MVMEKEVFDETIYKLPFKGFENRDLKKILLVNIETYNNQWTLKERRQQLISSRLFDRYEYRYSHTEGNKHIAFYSDFFYREDHKKNFTNFICEFNYFDAVIPEKLRKERFNLKRMISMLRYDIKDNRLLKKTQLAKKERLFILKCIGLVRRYSKNMNKYLKNSNYQFGLVYSDSCPYENIVVQDMKEKGIFTATLQHGIFDLHNAFKGVEWRASVSDDVLTWGTYAKKLAIECGIPDDRVKTLGIPRYIREEKPNESSDGNVFDVVLGTIVLRDENLKLVQFANQLADMIQMKYFLRYHPSCIGSEYNDYVDKKYYIVNESRNEDIKEMCERTKFVLIASGSSVVFDLIYLNKMFFEYRVQRTEREPKGRNNYFENIEELRTLVEQKPSIALDVFEYYCTTRNVKKSYDDYFKQKIRKIN